MIEENVKLQEEEHVLMIKVKKLQAKKKGQLKDGSSNAKKLTSTLGRSKSPQKRGAEREDFSMDL